MIFLLFPSPEKMIQDYHFEPIEAIHWKDKVGKSKKRRAGIWEERGTSLFTGFPLPRLRGHRFRGNNR
jgi:hypothetical protein